MITKEELLENARRESPDCRDTMHLTGSAQFKIPRINRALRASGGLIMASMTNGKFAVDKALREGAEVGRLTPVFDSREAADKFFNETKEAK